MAAGVEHYEQQFQAIFDTAPVGIWLKDVTGRYVLVNQRWLAWAGLPEEQVLGRRAADVFPDEDGEPLRVAERAAVDEDRTVDLEETVRRAERDRSLLTSVFPLRDDEGTVHGVCGISTDLSEQQRAVAALAESERRYRSLFASLPLSLWEEDFSAVKAYVDARRAEGVRDFRAYFAARPEEAEACAELVVVTAVNQAAVDGLGVASEEILLGPLGATHGAGTSELFREELCALAEGRTVFEGEGETHDPTGRRYAFNVKVAVASGHETTWDKVWVALTDITGRRRAEAAAHAAERETAKLATAHQMIATLHHEINNPLQGVLGFAEYLQGKLPADHEFARAIEKIFRGAVKIEALVHKLENLVRVEPRAYLGQSTMVDLERSTDPEGRLNT